MATSRHSRRKARMAAITQGTAAELTGVFTSHFHQFVLAISCDRASSRAASLVALGDVGRERIVPARV